MNLSDLIPKKEDEAALQDIEKQLESRRYKSWGSLLVATLSMLAQTAYISKGGLWFTKNGSWNTHNLYFLVPLFVGGLVFILCRYTGFRFAQSKEPFRYTVSIAEFVQVDKTPAERFNLEQLDRLQLLRADLIERLTRRVRRFSLLDKEQESDEGARGPSHFQIEGEYAIRQEEGENAIRQKQDEDANREEESGGWIIHVWPRVRIGPAGNSFKLAHPIRLPIEDGEEPKGSKPGAVLDLEEYERLVERIYSSIATEIYKQIQEDLRYKMTLFPTGWLRAFARYVEAEDFETSNTIDAYDHALDMYQYSLDELEKNWWHRWWLRLGINHLWLVRSIPFIRGRMEAEALTRLGYSRCMISRNLVSAMAGRETKPLFEARPQLKRALELLRHCYNSFLSARNRHLYKLPELSDISDEVDLPLVAIGLNTNRFSLRRLELYKAIRNELCETFAVAALAYSLLIDSERAKRHAKVAGAFANPQSIRTPLSPRVRLFLLLANVQLEPDLKEKLKYLNDATDLDPESEPALYQLAYFTDILARDNDEITEDRVEYVSRKYEEVLKVNPANIAALIGQGYLWWLVDEPEKARRKFKAGIELQKIVRQTFVGDLRYCMARLELEQVAKWFATKGALATALGKKELDDGKHQLSRAIIAYEEALFADPSVAASLYSNGRSKNNYFERMNLQILGRYKLFLDRVEKLAEALSHYFSSLEVKRMKYTSLCHSQNDYRSACLNYSVRLETEASKRPRLRPAIGICGRSRKLDPANVMSQYNEVQVLQWANDDTSQKQADKANRELVTQLDRLPPGAMLEVVIGVANQISEASAAAIEDLLDGGLSAGLRADEEDDRIYIRRLREKIEQIEDKISKKEKERDKEESEQLSKEQATPGAEVSTLYAQQRPAELVGSVTNLESPEPSAMARADPSKPMLEGGVGSDPNERDSGAWNRTQKPQLLRSSGVQTDEKKGKEVTEPAPADKVKTPLDKIKEDLEALQRHRRTALQQLGFAHLEIPVRNFVKKKTRLAPFIGQLRSDEIHNLLNNDKIRWEKFRDAEVFALMAFARIWARSAATAESKVEPEATVKAEYTKKTKSAVKTEPTLDVCKLIFLNYYPEYLDLHRELIVCNLREDDERRKRIELVDLAVEWWVRYDPKSIGYQNFALELHEKGIAADFDESPRKESQTKESPIKWPKQFVNENKCDRAIERYEAVVEPCKSLAWYHNSLAYAYEWKAKDRRNSSKYDEAEARKDDKRSLEARIEALRLEPQMQDYENSLLRSVGKQLISSWVSEDPQLPPPKILDVEFSSASISDLGFKENEGVPGGLQEMIKSMRDSLRTSLGFVLPGIKFRDNQQLARGSFHFLARGVPLALEAFPPEGSQEICWKRLTDRLPVVVPLLYNFDDCRRKLGEISKDFPTEVAGIQDDAESVFKLTLLVRQLLFDGVTVDFKSLVPAFQRCRKRCYGMAETMEAIRSVPQFKGSLPGNSAGPDTIYFIRLDSNLEKSVEQSVDRSFSEPILDCTSDHRCQVRTWISDRKLEAGGRSVVLLTSPAARPFVREMLDDMNISVLSHAEHVAAMSTLELKA